MSRPVRTAVAATLLVVSATVGGAVALTGNEPVSAADACVTPPPDDHAAAEAYAACRAAELAGVLASLPPVPTDTVTATVTATETATATATVTATTTATVTVTPSPTPTEPPPPPPPPKIIGMSAASNLWAQRLSEVGSCGVEARRIFSQITSTGHTQQAVIQQAVADGMLPVVSYKVPNVSSAATGANDAVAQSAAAFLNSLGVEVAVTVWHEPNGDMTGPQYVAMTQRLLPIFAQYPNLKVGPIFNGFMTDTASGTQTLQGFTSPTLWNLWDFYGYDTYDGPNYDPADRIGPHLAFAAANGKPNIPQLIGEYNAITAQALTDVGEGVLSTPQFWIALLWNTNADPAIGATVLSGERLAAYQATKADARALHDPAC